MMQCRVLQAFLFALLFMAFLGCQRAPSGNFQTGMNSMAPDFSLSDLNGKTVSLAQFKGKVIILDFWATWCPPCRREIPHFVELYKKYQDKGLAIVGISLDDAGIKAVKPFVEEFNVDYPILFGDEAVQKAYGGIQGIPTTYIIDKTGKIVAMYVGYQDIDVIERKIQPLL